MTLKFEISKGESHRFFPLVEECDAMEALQNTNNTVVSDGGTSATDTDGDDITDEEHETTPPSGTRVAASSLRCVVGAEWHASQHLLVTMNNKQEMSMLVQFVSKLGK
jgi:hypothetical protein